MLQLHRGIDPLFIPPAEEAPPQHLYIRLADSPGPAGFSSECSNHRGAFKEKKKKKIHLLSLLPSVCARVFFKLLSPGHFSCLCHIRRRPIRAAEGSRVCWFNDVEKKKADARSIVGDGWTSGEATSYPHELRFGTV